MVVWVAVYYYGGKWVAEQADGKLTDVGKEAADALVEAGVPYVDAVEAGLADRRGYRRGNR